MNTPLQKPTREQVEKYIQYADAELGPECEDEWVEWCRQVLRSAIVSEGLTVAIRTEGGGGWGGVSENTVLQSMPCPPGRWGEGGSEGAVAQAILDAIEANRQKAG